VRWTEESDLPREGTGLRLNWREQGGPPVSPPLRKGFGSRLIENLGNGETSYPVAEQLNRQGIPFASLTGYGEAGVRKTFQNRPVVPKPVSEAHLVETLRQLRNG